MMKKNEDHCGCKTVYTPQGLQGNPGPPGTGLVDYTVVSPRTSKGPNNNEIQGVDLDGYTDIFQVQIDRLGFLEAVEMSIETPPAGSVGFSLASFSGAGVHTGSAGNATISAGNSSAFIVQFGFMWTTLGVGQHDVVLRFVADPVTGIADKLITVHLNIT